MAGQKIHEIRFLLTAYFFVFVWGLLSFLRVLWEIIKHPIESFKKTERDFPQCLADSSLGEHEFIKANGIKFHCVHSGDRSKPLMLLLHGFPEFWYSWRHQIPEFSQYYHVVAIDTRGYGQTDKPSRKSDYTLAKLREDIAELIKALGYSRCVLVGHDWGAGISWTVAHKYPELVDRLIVLNSPHPSIMKRYIANTWAQFLKSWYMLMFKVPMLPEFMFRMHDYSFFNAVFRSRKAGVQNRDNFSLEAVEVYKYVFSQPGALTPPINYIRCAFNDDHIKDTPSGQITTPSLLIWGDKDAFMESAMADNHGELVADLTVKHLPHCSHWAQQDDYQKVNQLIKEFLRLE